MSALTSDGEDPARLDAIVRSAIKDHDRRRALIMIEAAIELLIHAVGYEEAIRIVREHVQHMEDHG